MISRFFAIAAVAAALLAPETGAGQPPLVLDSGRARPPTAAEVLERLAAGDDRDAGVMAKHLLRQTYGPMPEAEIEALIDAMVDLMLADTVGREALFQARHALVSAVWRPGTYLHGNIGYLTEDDLKGEPVPAAFDALVRVYETRAARALAEGGDDPFLEAARRDFEPREAGRAPPGRPEHDVLLGSLRDIFNADQEGRGWAYVLALFERSKPPQAGDRGSIWCAAGHFLHYALYPRPGRPGPDPERYRRFCSNLARPSLPF